MESKWQIVEQRVKITPATRTVARRTIEQRWINLPAQMARGILDVLEWVATYVSCCCFQDSMINHICYIGRSVITEIDEDGVRDRVQQHLNAILRR